MNLSSIPDLAARFGLPVGLSDHTMTAEVALAAVALGACIIEKHLTLSRDNPGPDSAFSLEPPEFKAMVEAVRTVEAAMGTPGYQPGEAESKSTDFRRSLFIVEDIAQDALLTAEYVPDRTIIEPAAFGRYLESLSAVEWDSLEELATTVLGDFNNELVARWVRVLATAPEEAYPGVGAHEVTIEDRQPEWDNPALLSGVSV
jgi:hypothetical protein